jgi:predicted MFS family arabinose efflux permease
LGALLATVGFAGIVYGLLESPQFGFRNTKVVAALMIGVLALLTFLFVQTRVKNPMVPLGLFKSKDFAGANLLTLLLYAALSAAMFFLTLNLIQIQGYSATAAGAAFFPFVLIMFVLARWSGGLVDRYGPRLPLIIGPVVAGIGFALFVIPGTAANYWKDILPAVCFLGLGMAISVAPLTTTVMGSVKQELAGLASGINNAVSRAAGLLAIAVLGVVMLFTFNRYLQARLAQMDPPEAAKNALLTQSIKLGGIEVPTDLPPGDQEALRQAIGDSFVGGYRVLMIIAACLAFASAACSWIFIGRARRD